MSAPRLVVIAGGGVAALRAAERLLERGYDGRIEIIAAETHAPYRRHALTERPARAGDAQRLRLRARLGDRVRWHHGRAAAGLDLANRTVLLDDGRPGPYERLVIATGTTARTLPGAPAGGRVLTLRTLGDAARLHALARRARQVLIVGGGLIGSEAAAMLRACGVRVTVVDIAPTMLTDALGARMGAVMTALHRRRGVRVELSGEVAEWEEGARGLAAHLRDGRVLHADAALVAIGGRPAVDWLAGAGLDLGNGVRCSETTHVAGLEDVVACGDCARWPNLRFGGAPRRLEQWSNAVAMGRHAADALLDGRAHARPFTPVPWGWTDQYGQRITMVGRPLDGTVVEAVGDPGALRGALLAREPGGLLVGALVANDPPLAVRIHSELARTVRPPARGPRAGTRFPSAQSRRSHICSSPSTR